MRAYLSVCSIVVFAISLPGCGDSSKLAEHETVGSAPTLPNPEKTLFPTVHIASAKGWPQGASPKTASGLKVEAFTTGLQHPRWLYVLPNGDVLVAESDGPERPADAKGIKGWIYELVQKWAGSGTKSADRITLIRGNGVGGPQTKTVFIQGLHSPFGMALIGHDFYVANANEIVRFPYQDGATSITSAGERVVALPGGPINHHWTKNIIANRDGTKLYAAVGSNSNVGENGLDVEVDRARILEVDVKAKTVRDFATGLRNPVGMGWEPRSGELWAVANERDELGSDLVPDYLTSVKDGAFYGWPFSYWGQHVDDRVKPQNPDMVAKAIKPDYALGNHVAPLGMTFAEGAKLPSQYSSGVFVGEHGSWNRRPYSGYKVVFVPFANAKPAGDPIDVLTGFVQEGKALGRPVGLAISRDGSLLVADDVGNTVWRVSAVEQTSGL
jgi:glucose/arabinose dehydrogenase